MEALVPGNSTAFSDCATNSHIWEPIIYLFWNVESWKRHKLIRKNDGTDQTRPDQTRPVVTNSWAIQTAANEAALRISNQTKSLMTNAVVIDIPKVLQFVLFALLNFLMVLNIPTTMPAALPTMPAFTVDSWDRRKRRSNIRNGKVFICITVLIACVIFSLFFTSTCMNEHHPLIADTECNLYPKTAGWLGVRRGRPRIYLSQYMDVKGV